jgi:hypothetical protein
MLEGGGEDMLDRRRGWGFCQSNSYDMYGCKLLDGLSETTRVAEFEISGAIAAAAEMSQGGGMVSYAIRVEGERLPVRGRHRTCAQGCVIRSALQWSDAQNRRRV